MLKYLRTVIKGFRPSPGTPVVDLLVCGKVNLKSLWTGLEGFSPPLAVPLIYLRVRGKVDFEVPLDRIGVCKPHP